MIYLNPSLPLETPKGRGECVFVIDYSPEHDLMFVVIIDETGEIWTFKNSEVRGVANSTLGRKASSRIPLTPNPSPGRIKPGT